MTVYIRNLLHKIYHWEYWPGYIVNIPAFLAWIWYAIRSGNPYFFSAANPVIETGGLWGESKRNILERFPPETLPFTIFISQFHTKDAILDQFQKSGLHFPVIAKPDIGERGIFVEKISDEAELSAYIDRILPVGVDFLIQEYVDFDLELAILYCRFPGSPTGQITSVCIKDFLTITGDGRHSIEAIIDSIPRARFQKAALIAKYGDSLKTILPAGEKKMLVPIGNHRLGTTFLNGAHIVDEALTNVFDRIIDQVPGINYGRFDMKCRDLESLKKGLDIKILEFNGVGSDPAHIYDPGYSFISACRDYFYHWQLIYRISRENKQRGVTYMTGEEARRIYHNYKRVMKAMA